MPQLRPCNVILQSLDQASLVDTLLRRRILNLLSPLCLNNILSCSLVRRRKKNFVSMENAFNNNTDNELQWFAVNDPVHPTTHFIASIILYVFVMASNILFLYTSHNTSRPYTNTVKLFICMACLDMLTVNLKSINILKPSIFVIFYLTSTITMASLVYTTISILRCVSIIKPLKPFNLVIHAS